MIWTAVLIIKFSNDTKIVINVANDDQIKVLQLDLHKIFECSQDWLMLFNTDKSKVMHFGFSNKVAE